MEILIDGKPQTLSLDELYELIKKDNNKYSTLYLSSEKDEDVMSLVLYGTFEPSEKLLKDYEHIFVSHGIDYWIRTEIVPYDESEATVMGFPRESEILLNAVEIPKKCLEHL